MIFSKKIHVYSTVGVLVFYAMVSYDWANGGSVGVFFRHCMVSSLWGSGGGGGGGKGGVSAILGNGYEIQGQGCAARLHGRLL